MRTVRILALAVTVLLSLVPALPEARASGSGIADLPVSFVVRNTNTSGAPCPSDGRTYTLRGHLVGPRRAIEDGTAGAVTVHLFGWEAGEWNWRLPLRTYDHAVEMAKLGHVSLTFDMLGYGSSDHPHGDDTCIGAQADMAHQIVQQLRAGAYSGATPTAFSTVVLAGHDVGGLIAEVEAFSYDDIDGLVVVTWADQGFTPWILQRSTEAATTRCALEPSGYIHFVDEQEFRTMLFHDPELDVVDAAVARRNPNPCGMHRSAASSVVVAKARTSEIDVPVLVVFGDDDTTVWTREGQEQQAANYGSDDTTTAFVPDAGHFPMLERTAPAFRSILSGWLHARFPAAASASANDPDVVDCTWGGTPDAPTGVVRWEAPGVHTLPSDEPIPFTATGELAGDDGCSGTMAFTGHYHAGSSCPLATDDGDVTGLPGVVREETVGVTGFVTGPLYDEDDEVVGTWYAQVFTDKRAGAETCESEEGVRELVFSGGVQLTYRP